jgi:hypothetical protein
MRMSRWEYHELDFGAVALTAADIDILNALGQDGWELVRTTSNKIAYLKRKMLQPKRTKVIKPSYHAKTSDEYKLIG